MPTLRARLPTFSILALLPVVTACSSSSTTTPGPDASHDGAASRHDAGHESGLSDARAHDVAPRKDVDTGSDAPLDVGGPTEAGKPPKPAGDASGSKTALNFAIHHLWLGDSLPDPAFPPDPTGTAWSKFGYNIDGLVTNESSTDVCTLNTAAHATTKVQIDGVDGIDNSFGKNIVPFLASVLSNLSESVSTDIEKGSFTILLGTTGLLPSLTQTNTGLTGALFQGAAYGGAPATNDAGSLLVTDDWPVSSGSIAGGRASLDAGAAVQFPSAYVSNGLWVNGTPGDVTLDLSFQGQPLVLQIHQAIITFHHTADATGQDHATGGIISGVLKASEFLREIDEVAAQQHYCSSAGLLLNFIASTADILADGTNVAGKACDGISIGLAFDADAIAAPDKVVQAVDAGGAPPPCVPDGDAGM